MLPWDPELEEALVARNPVGGLGVLIVFLVTGACCCTWLVIVAFWRRRKERKQKKERRHGMRYAIDPMASEREGNPPQPLEERSIPAPVLRALQFARCASSRVLGGELSYGTLGRGSGADSGIAGEPEAVEMDRRFSSRPLSRTQLPAAPPPPPPSSSATSAVLGWNPLADGQWRRMSITDIEGSACAAPLERMLPTKDSVADTMGEERSARTLASGVSVGTHTSDISVHSHSSTRSDH